MSDERAPFHNPFAALAGLRKNLPDATDGVASGSPPPQSASPQASEQRASIPRAVVRIERTGRSGKAVTVIDHLGVKDLEPWLKALKSSLGCGGAIEGDRIVLQGDQRERLKTILPARGVKKVVLG